MTDAALSLLLHELQACEQPALWLLDEQVPPAVMPPARPQWQCLSNRVDVVQALREKGYAAVTSDFDFEALGAAFAAVFYRVSKEKPLVHHLINQSLARLPLGGELYLAGYKGDGLRTYADKAAALVGGERELVRGKGGAQLAIIRKSTQPAESLDDSDYLTLRNIAPPELPALYSKPGVFGWQKIDQGSALLVQQLPAFFESFAQPPQQVLDLGCGYGYITVMAHALLPAARYIATDNNAAAVAACQRNFAEHDIAGEVQLADAGDGIAARVEALLCNPPFHRGFDIHGDLTEHFLRAARRLLAPRGQALFVVNQFIALERKAEGLFGSVEKLAEGGGFKVLRLAV